MLNRCYQTSRFQKWKKNFWHFLPIFRETVPLTHELVHDTAAIELFTGKLSTDKESQLQQPLLPASHPVLIARTTTSDTFEEDWYSSPTSTLLDCVSTASESQLSSEIHAQQSQLRDVSCQLHAPTISELEANSECIENLLKGVDELVILRLSLNADKAAVVDTLVERVLSLVDLAADPYQIENRYITLTAELNRTWQEVITV